MRRSLGVVWLGILLGWFVPAAGVSAEELQPDRLLGESWRWRIFDRDEGVSPGVISATLRTADDFLYAASDRGLSRYDLHHWDRIENVSPFDDGRILRIVESPNAVYCASASVLWRAGNELSRVFPERGGVPGRLFVASNRRGEVFIVAGGTHYRVRDQVERLRGEFNVPIDAVDYQIDEEGTHWIATPSGLLRRAESEEHWSDLRDADLPYRRSR
ncbi:MAG: hypothetical protein AAF517_01415, partial [Planctomycetota bacterium]